MVDVDVISAKLKELAHRIAKVRGHNLLDARELERDEDRLDLVSFNLMLAVQACLDIASHIISDEEWTVAVTMGESFRSLAEHGVVSQATAAALNRAVGLRNIVAHGYSKVEPGLIHAAARTGPAELERFGEEVAAWVRAQHS
jgi:uncharacterized protein YutE (UPF0331/DUF86 family)